jgi:hypothetical protein
VNTGYGIYIENLANTGLVYATQVAAIRIGGLGDYGRIEWPNAQIATPSSGLLQLSGTDHIQLGAGVMVGNDAGIYYGLTAGSLSIGNAAIITIVSGGPLDGTRQISTDGVINSSVGYLYNGATPTVGHYLRSDGSRFVDGAIALGDIIGTASRCARFAAGTGALAAASADCATGTVTSVAVSVPTGLTITSGSPITGSGTIAIDWSGTIPSSSIPYLGGTYLHLGDGGTVANNLVVTGTVTANSGFVSSSGISAAGFNPTGYTGATIDITIGACTMNFTGGVLRGTSGC